MTQFKNLKKKRSTLGTPPSSDTVTNNLNQPESVEAEVEKVVKELKKTQTGRVGRPVSSEKTAPFSTKLRPEFKKSLKMASVEFEMDMGDLIEKAVTELIAKKRKSKA